MLAYHPYWLEAWAMTREAERLARRRLITAEQMKIIRAAFSNPLYVPSTTERMTLYLFTCIAIAATFFAGVNLFPGPLGEATPVHSLLTGLLCIVVLEVLLKLKKPFRAGVDDALLQVGLALILVGTNGIMREMTLISPLLGTALVALPLFAVAAIRYVDRFVATAAFACLLLIVYLSYYRFSVGSTFLLPFLLMAVSGAVYAWHRSARTAQALLPWTGSIKSLGIASLISFYLAGNTFVLQHVLTLPIVDRAAEPVGLASVSFVLTLCVPLVYIVAGLIVRDRTLLRVGLLVEALTLATTRYYYRSIPLEHALIILGFTLILFSVATMHMLRSKKTGFTLIRVPPLQIPEEVPISAIVLYDRFTAQKEAVRAFEAGKNHLGGGASLGW